MFLKRLLYKRDNLNPSLAMPKALTASFSTFDGKSEKFKLFEDLFRNIIKMYPPHGNSVSQLFRGDALQAFRNLDDSEKDSIEEIMPAFKRPFGDFLSMARACCE